MISLRPARKKKDKPEALAGNRSLGRLGLILILLLTGGCVATIGAVWWYYSAQKREIEAATLRGISAVAAMKTSQIANWRIERISDGRWLMLSHSRGAAWRVLAGKATDADRNDVLAVMQRLSEAYTDATLADVDGNVRLRLLDEHSGGAQFSKSALAALARHAVGLQDAFLSDLTPDTRSGKPLMTLTVPVQDLGALILDIDPAQFLYPYMETWPGDSRTAESMLVRREGKDLVYLSRRRNTPATGLFTRRPISMLPPDSVLDAGWSLQDRDYRGVPAMGTVRRVPDSPWYVVLKIDLAEVDAPLRRLLWGTSLIAALITLSIVIGVELIWNIQQARIHRDREAWFYAAVNDTPAYLWMATAAGQNSLINKPLREFFGCREEALPKPWTEYLHPDDLVPVRTGFRQAIAETRRYSGEFRLRRWDGQYRVVVSEGVPRFSEEGKFLGYAGSVVDITARRRAEEQARALSARLITAQEDERKRLARELHDDLNQQIAAVSIAIGNLKRQIPADQADPRIQIDRIHQRLVQLAESVRRMSHQLHPAILEYQGLPAALRSCCEEFAALTGIRVSFRTDGAFDGVPPTTALSLYRITQEALQNIVKHAHSATAEVTLNRSEKSLNLTVSDSGVGIDAETAESNPGLGLISIQERARLAGGKVQIRGEVNQGTRLTVEIPAQGSRPATAT